MIWRRALHVVFATLDRREAAWTKTSAELGGTATQRLLEVQHCRRHLIHELEKVGVKTEQIAGGWTFATKGGRTE